MTGEESERIEVRGEFKQPLLREQIRAANKQVLRNIGFHEDDEDVNPFK
ncbi:hypothetical protein ABES03_02475 [Neobacillus rhizosphaerae]